MEGMRREGESVVVFQDSQVTLSMTSKDIDDDAVPQRDTCITTKMCCT